MNWAWIEPAVPRPTRSIQFWPAVHGGVMKYEPRTTSALLPVNPVVPIGALPVKRRTGSPGGIWIEFQLGASGVNVHDGGWGGSGGDAWADALPASTAGAAHTTAPPTAAFLRRSRRLFAVPSALTSSFTFSS